MQEVGVPEVRSRQINGGQAASDYAVGVATNTPRRVGRCEVVEEEEDISGASSMSWWQNAQQKRRVR